MKIVPILSIRTLRRLGAGFLILALFPAAASAQSSTSAAPGGAAALPPAPDSLAIGGNPWLATAGSAVDQPSAGDTSATGKSSQQAAVSAGTNPAVHSGPYYSGLLQQALGLSPDAPIVVGGLAVLGGNWLASGGLKPNKTTGDAGTVIGAMVDMDKLVRLPGADIYASFLEYQGARTNQAAGSVQIYDGLAPASFFSRQELFELWWRQRLLDDKLTVKIGKIAVTGEFDAQFFQPVLIPRDNGKPDLSTVGSYLTWGAYGNPTLFTKIPTFPNTAWGATILFQPTINAYVKYGVFDGNGATGVQTGLKIGPIFNDYRFHIGEVGYSWLLGDEGKPGQFGAGVWGQTGALQTPDGETVKGATGFYAFGSQRLWYQHPGVDTSGLIGWFQFGYTNSHTNEATRYVGVGVTALSLIPGRPYDQVNVGLAWSKLNPAFFAGSFFFPDVPLPYSFSTSFRSSELMMQAAYQLDLIPNVLAVQATYTAIPTPGARPGIPWANAFTVRTTLIF